MKNKRFLAALLSAAMIFSSAPYTAFASASPAASESTSATDSSPDRAENNNGTETGTSISESTGTDVSATDDQNGGQDSSSSSDAASSSSSVDEKPEIKDVGFKVKDEDKADKDGLITLAYDESLTSPSDLITVEGLPDNNTVSYTVNGEKWEETNTKTPFTVGKYEITVTVSRSGYEDLVKSATFAITAANLDQKSYEDKFSAASVIYDGASHELLTVSGLAGDDVVSYTMDGKESDSIPSASKPGQYNITVKIKKGLTEKEQANYKTLSFNMIATIVRNVSADVQYSPAVKRENNTLYYNQNAKATFSVTTKDFESQLAGVQISKDGGDYKDVTGLSWNKKDDSSDVYTADYTIPDSGIYRFRVTYQDVSGNAKVWYETNDDTLMKIVIDTNKPVIGLSYDKGNLSDTVTSFPYSRTATITVRDDNLPSTPASVAIKAVSVKDGSDVSDAYIIGSWEKKSDGTYTCKVDFQKDADYSIQVSAEDQSGNTAETSDEFVIDTTKPKISIAYDNNDSQNEYYFNAARTMTLTVSDDEADYSTLDLPVTIDGTSVSMSLSDLLNGEYEKYGIVLEQSDKDHGTFVISFGKKDNSVFDYTVSASVKDKAGNISEAASYASGTTAESHFIIDKVTPIMKVSAQSSNIYLPLSTIEDTPSYSTKAVTISIDAADKYFDTSSVSAKVMQKNANGDTVSVYQLPDLSSGWTENNGAWQITLPEFTKDANYSFEIFCKDKAGNVSDTYGPYYFTVDQTAPSGSLSISDGSGISVFSKLSDTLRFWIFKQKPVTINGSAEDAVSGLLSVEYMIYAPDQSGSSFAGLTYDQLAAIDAGQWKTWTGSVTINASEKGFLYLKLIDKAGNVSFLNTSDGIIVDDGSSADIQITPQISTPENGIYQTDVPFTINVSVPDKYKNFTGIRHVTWRVESDGKITQSGNYDNETNTDSNRSKLLRSFSKTETVKASLNNSNNVKIYVVVEDWAGNKTEAFSSLAIDVTAPTISASYDNNNVRNGLYFNAERNMTLAVKERNFDENGLILPIQIGEDKVNVTMQDVRDGKYGLTMVADRTDSEKDKTENTYTDGRTNTYVIGFGHSDRIDQDYTISASVTDTAGNKSGSIIFAEGTKAASAFTIDKVAPILTITADSDVSAAAPTNDKESPFYTRSDIVFTASVTERNFDTNGTKMTLTQTDFKGNKLSVYKESDMTKGWKDSGNTHVMQLPAFTKDANYSLSFDYTDLAGNKAVPYDTHYFTIDKTAPTGMLKVVNNDTASLFDRLVGKLRFWIFRNSPISVEGQSEDATSGVRSVSYIIYNPGTEARDEIQGLTFEQLSAETGWKPWNGMVSIDPDRAGFVYLRMEDKAGNVAFVNTSDGMIADAQAANNIQISLLSNPTGDGVYNSDVPFEISVTDPVSGDTYSGLHHISWEITNNGKVTQKGNYDSETDGDDNRSKRIASLTKKETVSAEKNNGNNIQIHVTTEDWAGNKAEKSASLMIDTTKPEISMNYDNKDVRNGKYYNKDRNMTLTIKERNFKESGVSLPITVDGQSYNVSMQDVRNGRLGLVMVSDASDSQSGVSKEQWTDDRTITYVIGFGHAADEDHDYTVSADAEDMAGNQSSNNGETFTIDKVAPVISVSVTSGNNTLNPSTDASNPVFSRSAAVAEVTILERNFNGKDASSQVTQKNADSKDVSVYSVPDVRKGWTSQNAVNRYTFPTFSNDANYSLSFDYTDLAGNRALSYASHYFTVDQTAPVGSLRTGTRDESGIFNTFVNLIRFWFYNNAAIPVSGTYHDETAGIASASYLIYEPGENAKGTFTGLTASELNSLGGWLPWNGSASIAPDKGAFVYVKLTDRAGNVSYINTSDGIVADNTAPSNINIELLAAPSAQNIFNQDVPFKVTVTDPSRGGTYSGLKHVSWEVLSNGTVTQSGSFDNSLGDRTARVQNVTGTARVEAAKNNSNRVSIRVRTEDWAGNTAEATKDLSIDTTKPTIEITYDHNNPVNGKYYNQTRTATIRIAERNFDPSKVNLKVTSTGQKPSISGWTISPQAGNSDSAVNTCTVTFSTDADYTLNASVTDKAGNTSDYNRTDSFTIDQTRPKITVSYSGGEGENGKYFNHKRTAIITVNEHNFDPSQFRIAIQAALDGKEISKPELSSWTSSGDIHTASVIFTRDGDYSFTAETGDLAGNSSEKYSQSIFTVDTTAPDLSFFDIKDRSANKDTVAPGIRATDLNFDPAAVILTLRGVKHQEKTVKGVVSTTANGISIKLDDFAHDKQTDDIYTLTARIRDKAGNTTEKSITFSVNRYGSNFTYSKKTADLLNKYYLNKGSELVIYETNVDQIVKSEIVILKDGTSTTLKKDMDYTVEDESEKNGWHKYKYTISKSCFNGEGLYEIQIRTIDKADNIQDNKVKDSPIRFVIDNTAPTAVLTGIENNGRYKENSKTMQIQVTDNYAYGSLTLYIGDKKIKTFDAETVAKADGKLSYKLESANGWQKIRVEYSDLAGNKGDPVSMRILITASTWQQILYSAWFIPTVIAVLCGFALLIFLIILLKRKKNKMQKSVE